MATPVADTATPARRAIEAGDDRSFVGHPKGLATLFFVELWERFSYYGMRAILLYYLVASYQDGGLGIPRTTGQAIVATYGAAVYLVNVLGGFAADRLVGARRSVLYGAVVIMCGHISLAIPGGAGFTWAGLVLISLGTGLLKPNASTMVGELYTPEDRRRDGGFEIFYMSVNIGSFVSPFVVAAMSNRFGYHAGFSVAAVGMALAITCYLVGRRPLHGAGDGVPNPLGPAEKRRLPFTALGVLALLAVIFLASGLWRSELSEQLSDTVALAAVIAATWYFVSMWRHPLTSAGDRQHLLAYIPLFIGAVLFWMTFEQAAGKMASFAEANTDLHAFGLTISPEIYQSINPLAIVVFAPIFGVLFTRRKGRFPSTPMKFTMGVTIIGLSALVMGWAYGAYPGGEGGALAPFWLLGLVFILQTLGELCLSPVGLSATTSLAPRHFASRVMGLWFLTNAVGQAAAAQTIVAFEGRSDRTFYCFVGVLTLVFAVILFALVPTTRRHMADVEEITLTEEGTGAVRV